MFTLVSLNIIKDSLDVIKSRNEKAELLTSFIINPLFKKEGRA